MPDPSKYTDDGLWPKGTKLYTVWIKDNQVLRGSAIYLGRNHSWHLVRGRVQMCMTRWALSLFATTPNGATLLAIADETNNARRLMYLQSAIQRGIKEDALSRKAKPAASGRPVLQQAGFAAGLRYANA